MAYGLARGFTTHDMTNSLVLLQKLCKNCPHPEKLHLFSKMEAIFLTEFSQVYIRTKKIIGQVEKSKNVIMYAKLDLPVLFFSK